MGKVRAKPKKPAIPRKAKKWTDGHLAREVDRQKDFIERLKRLGDPAFAGAEYEKLLDETLELVPKDG